MLKEFSFYWNLLVCALLGFEMRISVTTNADSCEPFHLNAKTGILLLNTSLYCASSEDFFHANDVQLRQNKEAGDFISWNIELEKEGIYWVNYLISSPEGTGWFELISSGDDGDESVMIDSLLPLTENWETYVNVQQSMQLSAGSQTITLKAIEGGWDIQWLEIQPDSHYAEETVAKYRSLSPPIPTKGFARTDGRQILDHYGSPLLLQGMGLGGWMLQEPYMVLFNNVSTQWEMFEQLSSSIAEESLEIYRQAWLDNWMTYDDVVELKRLGFNSIRVPLHYNLFTLSIEGERVQGSDTWLREGFSRIDKLLQWCERENLYVILDLHCAPGGQGRDAKISDYDPSKPSLWESPENLRKAVALWGAIAKRYADNQWLAGYDVLNEPNWAFEEGGDPDGCTDQFNQPLKAFYQEAIAAIREFDNNHIVYVQGNCWGSNHNGLWPIDDDNVALSFHHYWMENTVESIASYLQLRDAYNIPLWMGEAGENHNHWKTEAVNLLESHDIGWAFWTWKKVASTSSSYSIDEPDGYFVLRSYWSELDRFYPSFVEKTMMQLAENTLLANCRRNVAAIEALTGHDRSCNVAGYTKIGNVASTKIESEDFCSMLGAIVEGTTDRGEVGDSIGWFDNGDWLQYNIEIAEAGLYEASFRVSSVDGHGAFKMVFDDGTTLGIVDSIPLTGSWRSWTTISTELSLPAGKYTLTIQALDDGWTLNWFSFEQL
ncbi:hypothetical protein FisN_24Lh011 [Fistulifera solaris]|uniref:CBM6 domain-containing protein n=1 Tax=Fistulifera solaris TaxID=1519565 RepID=A0A1Z5KT96_FISSO|nr:hypothetical protein FisN_24Lh011 [Fistulifera solaris]|eukprot:GAX29560.1 hypothetical protein FisN_24Lh011 [Fistulifera solaris]